MLYDSLNHVINAFSPQDCWRMVQEKGYGGLKHADEISWLMNVDNYDICMF